MSVLRKKLYRDLWQRKGSLAALLVLVMVGVGSFVGMSSVWRDLDGERAQYYSEYHLADFLVDVKRAPEWALLETAAMPNVASVRGRVNLPVRLDVPRVEEPITGTAISMPGKRRPVLNDIFLRTGSWFSSADAPEAILNHSFAKAHNILPGDRIHALLLDREHDLLVTGTAMSPEFVYLIPPEGGLAPDPERFGVLYLPEDFLRKSADLEGAWNQIVGVAHDASPQALRNTMDLITRRLDSFGVTNSTAMADTTSVRFLHDELTGLRVSSRVTPLIFLTVAALVLNILIGRMIVQQRTIIGTLRAIGLSSGAIARHYLTYGVIIGILGGIVGMIFARWTQGGMLSLYNQFYNLPELNPHFYPDLYFVGFVISITFSLLGTINGLRAAARLAPADAMRPPPPEKGGRIFPERITVLWRPLPFRWKIIFRAIFRNPYRSIVSIGASVVATSLIFATLGMIDSLDLLVRHEFEKVSHQDVTVILRDPQTEYSSNEIGRIERFSGVEPQLGIACDFENGPHKKRLGITGLPPDAKLNTPLDANDQPLVIPAEGLVLSRKLSEILDAPVGTIIRLRPLIGERRAIEAPVTAIADTFLGMSAYANIDYLSRLIGEDSVANLILGKTAMSGGADERLLDEVRRRPTVVGVGERRRALSQVEGVFKEGMGKMIGMMVFFAGLIAFGSVLNTALVSLSERQREVGTLRVLGYEPMQITRIFSGESFLLNGLGVVIGLAGGVGLSYLLALAYNTELYRFPVVILPERFLHTTLLMVLFISLAQLIIARMVFKVPWLEVLKVKE